MAFIVSTDVAELPDYHWMAVSACIFGFFMSFGIGANDVGNCFATSVAAKSLTLIQAVFVAAVFEFAGAFLLGASVTTTIRSGILKAEVYDDQPEVLAFGMLVALVNASFWLILATAFEMPVSTTHTIVAAIVGFSLAANGWESVDWKGCSKIFISWIVAPAITAIFGYLFFFLIRTFVMKSQNPFKRAGMTYSGTIFVAAAINLFFVIKKGVSKRVGGIDLGVILGISFGAAFIFAIIAQFAVTGFLKRRVIFLWEQEQDKKQKKKEDGVETGTSEKNEEETDESSGKIGFAKYFENFANKTYKRDLERESLEFDSGAADIWESSEQYDEKTEILYSYLQVFTACCLSFAHGANDVANAIAPICAVLAIYESGKIEKKSAVPREVLALGGFGIVVGLFLYGYKVIKSLGYRLVKMSPSRGFCIELSTSLVVVTASYIGIPVSTTQSTIGGTIGVGAVEGIGQVQWPFMLKVFFGWVVTFFVTCISSAGIMAFSYYSPSPENYAIPLNITRAA